MNTIGKCKSRLQKCDKKVIHPYLQSDFTIEQRKNYSLMKTNKSGSKAITLRLLLPL